MGRRRLGVSAWLCQAPGRRSRDPEKLGFPEQSRVLPETRLRETETRRNRGRRGWGWESLALLGPSTPLPWRGSEEVPVVMERVVNQCLCAASDTPTTWGRRSLSVERGRPTCCLELPTSRVCVCTCLMHAQNFVGPKHFIASLLQILRRRGG